jgi:O-antigen/teichoic acid export membrane protein
MLLMGGRSKLIMMDSALAFVANIALNVVLIPIYGMTGAAVAWSASIVLSNLLAVIQIRRLWGVRAFGRPFMLVAGSAVLCFGFGPIAAVALAGQQVGTLLLSTGLELLIYGAILWRMRARLGLAEILVLPRRGSPAPISSP